jgi:hypothetical protein
MATAVNACPALSGLDEDLALPAKTFDIQLNDVTGAEVRLVRQAESDAGRGARVDDITRLEDHELAQVPDDVIDPEDHVRGIAVLALVPID